MSRSYRVVRTSTQPSPSGFTSYTSSSRPIVSTTRHVSSRPVHVSRPVMTRTVVTSDRDVFDANPMHVTRPVITRTVVTSDRDRDRFDANPVRHVVTRPAVTRTVVTSDHDVVEDKPKPFNNMQNKMEGEMEQRRTDWEKEVDQLQHDFFKMKGKDNEPKPDGRAVAVSSGDGGGGGSNRGGAEIFDINNSRTLYNDMPDGSKVFRQRFDLHGYGPEDIDLKAEDGKLHILAKREEDIGSKKSTRNFNRSVEIPWNVDPDQISSSLNDDGILTIEGPVDDTRIQEKVQSEVRPLVESLKASPPEYDSLVHSTSSSFGSGGGGGGGGGRSRAHDPFNTRAISSTTSSSRFMSPDVEDTPYGKKWKMSVYLGLAYKPDDITVKLYDHKIGMDAKVEEVIGGRTSRKQFSRDFDLPEAIKRDTFRAVLGGDDGKLYLGGSFVSNDDHEGVLNSVMGDLPAGSRSCNIMF